MRVYQFRHIRADGQCSPTPTRENACTVFGLRRLAPVLPALLGSLVLLTAAGAGTSAGPTAAAASSLAEVVVTLSQPPLAQAILHDRALARGDDDASPARRSRPRKRELPADARLGAAVAPGADQRCDSRLERALALRRRARRDGRRRAALAARAAQLDPGRHGLAERDLPLAARPEREADRRADGLGTDVRDRGERR